MSRASSGMVATTSGLTKSQVVAPSVTVATLTTTACVQGYAPYSMQDTITALANAASIKIYVPSEDEPANISFD